MQQIKIILIGLFIVLCVGCGEKQGKENFRYFQNYQRTFNDLHARHLKVAKQWGITPITSDDDFEEQEDELSEITSCRYYEVDELTHSISYLVPRAEEILETIGSNFRDSLDEKGLPDRKDRKSVV